MIVVDTNVISELQKPAPNTGVLDWLNTQDPSGLFLTAISAAELMYGAQALPRGKRASDLQRAVTHIIEDQFRDRVLPFDAAAAYHFGVRMSECRRAGIGIGLADGQIGAIAVSKLATVATRDMAPFQAFGLDVINPFSAG